MKLDSRVYCRSEREALWAAIFNPEAWKASIPDAQDYEEVDENEYEMTVKADIGPVKGNQTIKLIFSDIDEPHSCQLKVENKMIKRMSGAYQLVLPSDAATEATDTVKDEDKAEAEIIPEETRTIFRYQFEVDMGNPMFNAIVEGFKGKVEEGFAEILSRLDNYAMGEPETTD